jgi:hypothetical protein
MPYAVVEYNVIPLTAETVLDIVPSDPSSLDAFGGPGPVPGWREGGRHRRLFRDEVYERRRTSTPNSQCRRASTTSIGAMELAAGRRHTKR